MQVPHVFVDPADCDDRRVRLHGPVAHHVLTVLRCGPGDAVHVADNTGAVRTATIATHDGASADRTVVDVDHAPRRRPGLCVVCGLPKRRKLLPSIAPVTDWRDACADAGHGVVFWEKAPTPLRRVQLDVRVDRVTVGVGSEGGLTAGEVRQTGLPTAGLGPTILRAETAGVVAPALVLQRLGRLG